MDGREPAALLGDAEGLVAHYASMLALHSGDHMVPGNDALGRCGIAFLSRPAAAAVAPLVRRRRFARGITVRQISAAGYGVRDSAPVVAGLTTVGAWQVLLDTGRGWPTQAITPDDTADGGRAVVVDWTASPVVVTDYVDGALVLTADLEEGPGAVPLGADLRAYHAAVAGLPWNEQSDLRAVGLALAARLTGEVLGPDFFSGRHRKVILRRRPVDTSDLLRDFHDYAAAHDPALLAIVADTGCGPASTRQIAVQSALMSVNVRAVADQPAIAEAVRVLAGGALPDGDTGWNRQLLELIEPKAAQVRERQGDPTQVLTPEWFALVDEVDAYRTVAAAFDPEPYRAAAHAWVSAGSVNWYLPGTKIFQDDHIRHEILLRCLLRAQRSGRYRF